jgi:hypothetical protein
MARSAARGGQSLLFLKSRQQKDFGLPGAATPRPPPHPWHVEKFFGYFFKKEQFLSPSSRARRAAGKPRPHFIRPTLHPVPKPRS